MFVSWSHDFMLCWLKVVSSKEKNASVKSHNNDSIGLETKIATRMFGAPHVSESTGKKEVAVLARVIDPGYQWEFGILLHSEDKEDCVWNPLWHLLVLLCLVIKINGKLQQVYSSRTTNGPDPSGMKGWVTTPK